MQFDSDVLQIITYQELNPIDRKIDWHFRNQYENYFKEKISYLLKQNETLTLPVQFEAFEQFFSGFQFIYSGIDNDIHTNIWGKWKLIENISILVRYAKNCVQAKQRFSIAHELGHVYQYFDPEFKTALSKLPVHLHKRVIELLANKIATYLLVPEHFFIKTYTENSNIAYQASLYQVAPKTIEICIETDYKDKIPIPKEKPPALTGDLYCLKERSLQAIPF